VLIGALATAATSELVSTCSSRPDTLPTSMWGPYRDLVIFVTASLGSRHAVALVRPDGYVTAVGTVGDTAAIRGYLQGLAAPPARTGGRPEAWLVDVVRRSPGGNPGTFGRRGTPASRLSSQEATGGR
jgi:hypothetical protein